MDNETFLTLKPRLGLPLAEIIRPSTLSDYIGQRHLINEQDGAISNFLYMGYIPSMILYGPPGVGKTTLASIIASHTGYVLVELSATDATVGDLKELSSQIRGENTKRLRRGETRLKVAVFIDEIHRFSTNQQDFLLPFIEAGDFVFIGATTVDPQKRIRRAILSRCQMFELQPLTNDDIKTVLRKASLFENIRRKVLFNLKFITFEEGAFQVVADYSHGDTRTAINFIELISSRYNSSEYSIGEKDDVLTFDIELVKEAVKSLTKARLGLTNDKNIPLIVQLFNNMNGVILYDQIAIEKPKPLVTVDSLRGSIMVTINYTQALEVVSDHEVGPLKASECPKPLDWDSKTQKWGPRVQAWQEHMDYSDDSDVEPANIYSDTEGDEEHPFTRISGISPTRFKVTSAVHTLLQLFANGESEFFILKQLILFVCMYVLPETPELIKVMAVLKALRYSTVNVTKLLSLQVEALASLPKSDKPSIVKLIRRIKNYCLSKAPVASLTPKMSGLQVIYDDELESQLLEEKKSSSLNATSIFNFSVDEEVSIEGYSLGWMANSVEDVKG